MKTFKILARFDAEIEIHAENIEEAIEKAQEMPINKWNIIEEPYNIEPAE